MIGLLIAATLLDFETATRTQFQQCHTHLFNATTLHLSCSGRTDAPFTGVPSTSGVRYKVVIFDGTGFIERSDCFLVQSSPYVIECRELFSSGFE